MDALALVRDAGERRVALQDTSSSPRLFNALSSGAAFSAPLMCFDGNPWRAAGTRSLPAATH